MDFNRSLFFQHETVTRQLKSSEQPIYTEFDMEDQSSCHECHSNEDNNNDSCHLESGDCCPGANIGNCSTKDKSSDYKKFPNVAKAEMEISDYLADVSLEESGAALDLGSHHIVMRNNQENERLISVIQSLRESVQENTNHYLVNQQRSSSGGASNAGGANSVRMPSRHGSHHHRRHADSSGSGKGMSLLSSLDDRMRRRPEKIIVEVRVVFLKIGEIDTLKEIYHADVFIQAKWREPRLDFHTSAELQQQDLDHMWSPLLIIDNILNESKDQYWLTAQLNEKSEAIIIERRRLKGIFLETLELNDFPLDVQDLTVTLTSERPDTEIDLVPDMNEMSGINLTTTVDQQEWRLHEHIEITKTSVTQEFTSSSRSHPCLSVTCRAARRPGYFYWNVFLIMFFITGLSFATFSLPHDRPENRLQLSFTLFLTSVAFKFVINQSLPKISYLTYMDKYVLMSLAILCIVSIWHAMVTLVPKFLDLSKSSAGPGVASSSSTPSPLSRRDKSSSNSSTSSQDKLASLEQLYNSGKSGGPSVGSNSALNTEAVSKIEKDVFISFCVLYFLAHMFFIFWLYFDASKRRREMKEKDRLFRFTKELHTMV